MTDCCQVNPIQSINFTGSRTCSQCCVYKPKLYQVSTLIQQTSSTAPLHSKQIREALIILLEFQSHEKYLWENTTRIKDMAKIHWIWTHFKTKKSHMLNIINTHLIFSRFKKNSRLINPPKVVRLTMRMEFWNAKKHDLFCSFREPS